MDNGSKSMATDDAQVNTSLVQTENSLSKRSDDKSLWDKYYSFGEMRPYLGTSVRIKKTCVYVARDSIYNLEQMESLAYLWRDGIIYIEINWESRTNEYGNRISAEDFLPILDSPTILQCRILEMNNAQFSFKDYKVLYTVNVIQIWYGYRDVNLDCWPEFLEQPGVKPLVVLCRLPHKTIDSLLERLRKTNGFPLFYYLCVCHHLYERKSRLLKQTKCNNSLTKIAWNTAGDREIQPNALRTSKSF
ncbi:hypothetical protein DdX_15749 [Ditylenchus destructor]|uniref:Uncharacterized protein n=1 Tax=Ditylenchus destructor TaxID=166010 RepID=A0AAD4MRJ7_9BILA|nr:hypothetical protein DdX_15749 [Ditylenchus destructor]